MALRVLLLRTNYNTAAAATGVNTPNRALWVWHSEWAVDSFVFSTKFCGFVFSTKLCLNGFHASSNAPSCSIFAFSYPEVPCRVKMFLRSTVWAKLDIIGSLAMVTVLPCAQHAFNSIRRVHDIPCHARSTRDIHTWLWHDIFAMCERKHVRTPLCLVHIENFAVVPWFAMILQRKSSRLHRLSARLLSQFLVRIPLWADSRPDLLTSDLLR